MAYKGRIGRRGKIRPLVRTRTEGRGPHWSITKRAAVWSRRRIIDEVFAESTFTLSDSVVPHLERFVNDSISLSDTANINGEKVVISSQTITDDGTIVKDFQQPANASSISLSDSVGFELGTLSGIFNAAKINDTTFGAIMADQEFYTDSISAADSLVMEMTKPLTESVGVSDSVGFDFLIGSVFNANAINLSQFNS